LMTGFSMTTCFTKFLPLFAATYKKVL